MAIVYSYPLNKNIKLSDELVGTTEQMINGQLKTVTRNFLLQDLAEFFIEDAGIQKTITLTTNGNSGASTLNQVTGVLNIPQYSGATDLDYIASALNGIVTSSTGSDATIPLANSTNAGLLSPANFVILGNTSGTNTGDQNLQSVTNLGATTTNSITANSFVKAGGVGNNVLLDNGNTIALTSLESETTSPITADLEVGGIADQQVIPIGTNLQEFATLLLNKTYYPELIDPTFSLTSNAGIREIGSSTSFTLTFTYNDGNILGATVGGIWLPTSSQGGRAGSAISYTINGTTQVGNTLSVSPVLLAGGNPFSGTVTYGAGIQPLDSKGFDYDEEYPAGTSPLRSVNIQGIYPYFWYKSSSIITAAGMQTAIANGTATKVLSSSTGTITIDFDAVGEYLAFAYPSTSTTKTIWFVTTLNSGTIPGGVFGAQTTLPCNSPTSLWSNVSYKIHTTAGLITELDPMQLRNS
jgi:hypothetical protein